MSVTTPVTAEELAAVTIRDLVTAHPETLTVLAPLGIDLCCGGAHPLGEALDLLGVPRGEIIPAIARMIGRERVD